MGTEAVAAWVRNFSNLFCYCRPVRYVDEIVGVFEAQPPGSKRYLLRCLERQPITVDSLPVLELFRNAETSEVADLAILLGDRYRTRVDRDRLIRASGGESQEQGQWSRFIRADQLVAPDQEKKRHEKAAAGLLSDLVDPLRTLVQRDSQLARRAVRILARIRTPESLAVLEEASRSDALLFDSMAALATFGGEQAGEVALALLERWEGTSWYRGLIRGLSGLNTPKVFAKLQELSGNEELLDSVVVALEGFEEFDYLPCLQRARLSPDPWVRLQVVETLGRLGGDTQVEELGKLLESSQHPLVQVACLKALTEAGGPRAGKIVKEALNSGSPLVQAAAIESLIALPVPKKDYRDRVLSLVDSEHPRLAMNAALACVVLDSKRAVSRVTQLIRSGQAHAMLQGVFSLAYIDHPLSAKVLTNMAEKAASPELRMQSLRALGRHSRDNPMAVGALAKFVASDDPQMRSTAVLFLADSERLQRGKVAQLLASRLPVETEPLVRATIFLALGLMGPAAHDQVGCLEAALEGSPLEARTAAWSLVSSAGKSEAAGKLRQSDSAALQAWGTLHSWYQGGGGTQELAELMGYASPGDLLDCLEAARLMVLAPLYSEECPGLRGLTDFLSNRARALETGAPLEPAPGGNSENLERESKDVVLISTGVGRQSGIIEARELIRPQIVDESTASANLDQANEVISSMAVHGPSKTEVMEAMHRASYFHIPQAEMEQLKAIQEAEARRKIETAEAEQEEAEAPSEEEVSEDTSLPEEEEGGGLMMIGAFLVAILVGQALRIVLR